MKTKYLQFSPNTSGEQLFQFILSDVIGEAAISDIGRLSILQSGARLDAFSEYFIGVFSFNLTGRCIKKAQRIYSELQDNSQHTPALIKFFRETLILSSTISESTLHKLAALTFEARANSGKKISDRTKKIVRSQFSTFECYICGSTLIEKSEDENEKIFYEHIWPSSYGGDSIDDNLLPACKRCNGAKSDMLLWQNSGVHKFILPPNPVEEEWKLIGKVEKIAKHRTHIFDIACEKKISLKEAAIEVGPMDTRIESLYADNDDDCIDFFNFSMRSTR